MIESLDTPYVYFETNTNLIGYSYGKYVQYNDDLIVGSVVGYFTDEETDRVQFQTGRGVKKLIYEGNEITVRNEVLKTYPTKIRNTLVSSTVFHPVVNEEMMTFKKSDITKIYSPTKALQEVLNHSSGASDNQIKIAQTVVDMFSTVGIKPTQMGIYGSLQAGVSKKTGDNDVDVVIFGLQNYKKVLEVIDAQNKDRVIPPSKYKQFEELENLHIASVNRKRNSKLLLGSLGTSDLRVVESINDTRKIDFRNLDISEDIIEIEGQVIDATESLTTPSVYQVSTTDGLYTVAARLYVFLGAARAGDRVKVRGRKINNIKGVWISTQVDQFILAMHN